jgi:hypothetical protein
MSIETTPGTEFARALAAKDFGRMDELFAPEVNFRAMTPRKFWEAETPGGIVTDVLGVWFGESDELRGLERLETESFLDVEHVSYRLALHTPEGDFLVDQQAYLETNGEHISWMRVMCAGKRPSTS